MLSRCPACATVFRVDTVQIRAREGRVRCGRCHAVFDALDAMVDITAARTAAVVDIDETPLPPAEPAPEIATANPAAPPEESYATLNVIDAPDVDVRFEASAVVADRLVDPDDTVAQPMPEPGENMQALVRRTTDYWGTPPQTVPAAAHTLDPNITQPLGVFEEDADTGREVDTVPLPDMTAEPADASPTLAPPVVEAQPATSASTATDAIQTVVAKTSPFPTSTLSRDPPLDPPPALEPVRDPAMQRIRRELYGDEAPATRSKLKTALWAIGGLLLLLLAVGQLTYHFRTDIALAQPALRPLLEHACARLGCTVPAPRAPDTISIEASELTPEPARSPVLRLSALLRNGAAFEQAWPHLELTLTDTTDRAVVRRVLMPAEFLPPDAPKRGFAPGSEQAIGVLIDPAASGASGYRLYAFYP